VRVVTDPQGKFVYVANMVAASISAYRIARNGALTPVLGSPFATGREPYSIAIDAANRCAYVASRFDKNISAYEIDQNGSLTQIAGSPFPAGVGPDSIACTRPSQSCRSSFRK
jgi:6-phosphogluconolactonase (cycloisomerase 2 family)